MLRRQQMPAELISPRHLQPRQHLHMALVDGGDKQTCSDMHQQQPRTTWQQIPPVPWHQPLYAVCQNNS